MPIQDLPIVSQWYRHFDKGQRFQVTAFDEDAGTVAIQNFDGDVEEIDIDEWYLLEVEPIEPPEDWTGPVDVVERDDLGYSDTGMSGEDWSEPLEEGNEEEQRPEED